MLFQLEILIDRQELHQYHKRDKELFALLLAHFHQSTHQFYLVRKLIGSESIHKRRFLRLNFCALYNIDARLEQPSFLHFFLGTLWAPL